MKSKAILTFLIFLAIYNQIPENQANHVIFESIGQMAGAITYLHAHLTINLTSIFSQVELYHQKLQTFRSTLGPPPTDRWGTHYYEPQLFDIRQLHFQQLIRVIEEHTLLVNQTISKLIAIQHMMPPPQSEKSSIIDDSPGLVDQDFMVNDAPSSTTSNPFQGPLKFVQAIPRSSKLLPFLPLALGAVGTFMGLFNTAQISRLSKELQLTRESHNKLVEVVQNQGKAIKDLEDAFNTWIEDQKLYRLHDPGLVNSWLNQARSLLQEKMDIVIHAIQQAQHRRLAVDFLSAGQLLKLYQRLSDQAQDLDCTLLTNHPSDLFQLELSYFFDGENIHLLLHVPAVPQDSLLRLFKLHPFPLPLSNSHFLIPSVKNDILAISAGSNRLSAQYTSTDLMSCHTVNSVYICERHGVLSKLLNTTCTGSLYLQDYDSVQELCSLEVTPVREVIHQLLQNWFLIYSPLAQTAYVECRNGTQGEMHIKAGISQKHLSPGCKAHFQQHLLLSDTSIRLPSDILHFEWNWNPYDVVELSENEVEPLILELSRSGIHRPSLDDLQHLKLQELKTHGLWYHTVHFIGNLCVFLLVIILICLCVYVIVQRKCKQQSQQALTALLDLPNRAAAAATAPLGHPPRPEQPDHTLQRPSYLQDRPNYPAVPLVETSGPDFHVHPSVASFSA